MRNCDLVGLGEKLIDTIAKTNLVAVENLRSGGYLFVWRHMSAELLEAEVAAWIDNNSEVKNEEN